MCIQFNNTVIIKATEIKDRGACFSFCKSVLNFNLVNNFSSMSTRTLIFHMTT